MLDQLLSMTALPNLHPALVHFPIALLPMALLFELLGLTLRKQDWLERAAVSLYAAAALGALVTRWAGVRASDGLVDIPAQVQLHIAKHSDWAHYSLWAIGALAVLRVLLYVRDPERTYAYARAGLLVVGLGAMGLLGFAADLGGGLVYQHGVAVGQANRRHAEPTSEPRNGESSREAGLDLQRSQGAVRWQPAPEDSEALGTVLLPATGFTLDAISWVSPTDGGAPGLGLEVSGKTLLILPQTTHGDVEVKATFVLESFKGTLGVAHHVGTDGDGGFFTVSTEGRAGLSDIRDGQVNALTDEPFDVPSLPFTLAVSAVGRHLRGLVDGATVTHAHLAPRPAGPAGLLFDGVGRLRLLSFEATVLRDQ